VTVCTTWTAQNSSCKRRKVQAQSCDGDITSGGGVMLVREEDRKLLLTEGMAQLLTDPRCKARTLHGMLPMLRQRVYGLALGCEDLNDHSTLPTDPAIQIAIEQDQNLASRPTLCRFENWASPQSCWAISRVLVEIFIESFAAPPAELILDFDSTDDLIHDVKMLRTGSNAPRNGSNRRLSADSYTLGSIFVSLMKQAANTITNFYIFLSDHFGTGHTGSVDLNPCGQTVR
jgi:hypothetical protein